MHVLNGCPDCARMCCCNGITTPFVLLFTPCICWSVTERLINPYEEQLLPEFEQEALVVTATGLKGYFRPLVDPSEVSLCYKPEKYVRGSSWEPTTLTWDNISRIELSHADGSNVSCDIRPDHF